MFQRFRQAQLQFPKQYWILFWGTLINSIGNFLVLPFLTLYLSEKLDVSLILVTSLLTVRASTTLISTFFIGPYIDLSGRKNIMVLSLAGTGITYILLGVGQSLSFFIIIMAINGLFYPLYRISVDAMISDLIPEEDRIDAFAIMRMITNAGIAIGPMIGGFMAVVSYSLTFFIAALFLGIFAVLIVFFICETIPEKSMPSEKTRLSLNHYGLVLADRHFVIFCLLYTLTSIATVLMFSLLPVYAKEEFGMPESRFGFLMATNAIMIVLFQFPVSHFTKKFNPYTILGFGTILFGFGLGSVAFGSGFPHFFMSMVILTCGELMAAPTAMTLAANMAPLDKRGRYMSLFNLTLGIALGIGPILGGILSDLIAPAAIWYGAAALCIVSMTGYFVFGARHRFHLN